MCSECVLCWATCVCGSTVSSRFYNLEGGACFTTYTSVFERSDGGPGSSGCTHFPGISVYEISTYGIPINKIVVGKPLLAIDGTWRPSGFP